MHQAEEIRDALPVPIAHFAIWLIVQLFVMWILTRIARLLQELEHDCLCEDPKEIRQGFCSFLFLCPDAVSSHRRF